jgi:hypothetical protein
MGKYRKSKKLFLITIVVLEVCVGCFFIYGFILSRSIRGLINGNEKTVFMDKKKTIDSDSSQYQYYWELEPNFVDKFNPDWLPYEVSYHYNNDGMNDMSDYSVKKKPNVFRIMTLGDSFTFGDSVNTEDSWPEQLETILNQPTQKLCDFDQIEVLNLGIGAFDIPYIVERYKRIGQKYNPDMIIWFESGSGFGRLLELLIPLIKDCKEKENKEDAQCWVLAQKEINSRYNDSYVEDIILKNLDDFHSILGDEQDLLFFGYDDDLLPKYEKGFLAKWRERYYLTDFLFIVPNDFGADADKYVLPDGHPSAFGHKHIADIIGNYLNQYLQSNLCP